MMDVARSDRLAPALVWLLALTGILRVWAIVDTFQLADRQNTTNYFHYSRMVGPLLQHLPLASLAVAAGIGIVRRAAFATWLPFWIGIFSVFAVDGDVQWAPWNALAATPLTCAGLLYVWRARREASFWQSASGGVIVALVSPAVAVHLQIFSSTGDFVFLGGVLAIGLLATYRVPIGSPVHAAVSSLLLVVIAVDAFDLITVLDSGAPDSGVEPEPFHGVMAMAGLLGCADAYARCRATGTWLDASVGARVLSAGMALTAVVYEVVPRYVPYTGWPSLICSTGDGGAIVHWKDAPLLRFGFGDGLGDGVARVGLSGNPSASRSDSRLNGVVEWVFSAEGRVLERSVVPFAFTCDSGQAITAEPADSPSRFRVRLGDRVVEGVGEIDLKYGFYSAVTERKSINGWPRFFPVRLEHGDDDWIHLVDLKSGEIGSGVEWDRRTELLSCDSTWCVLDGPGGVTFIDGETGRRMVTVNGLGHRPHVSVGGGQAWFQCADRHVCYVTYEDPTRVHGIDTDDLPEVIDHREPRPMAPAAPNR